jgi:uncharacterized lipoprotein NlpE involved in copper resistance
MFTQTSVLRFVCVRYAILLILLILGSNNSLTTLVHTEYNTYLSVNDLDSTLAKSVVECRADLGTITASA